MIPEQGISPGEKPGPLHGGSPPAEDGPEGWKEAILTLISSRLGIIQAESEDAKKIAARKFFLGLLAIFAAFFAWLLLFAGLIGALSAATPLSWYQIALIAAGFHLIVAIIAVIRMRAPSASPFPITRAEFEKDREWIRQLNKNQN